VALNVILVPRLGILGAAVALSASVVGTNLWALVEVRRRLGLFAYNRSYVKIIVSSLITALALAIQRVMFTDASWRAAGVALVLAYAVFFGAMLLLGLDSEDRMLARMVWNKIAGDRNGDTNGQYA